MRVYLDNNATTQIHPAVLSLLEETLRDVWGNASSIHNEGQRARRTIEDARESVARLIGATAREVVFTSGGTESNNAAIFGALSDPKGEALVTTAIEHPSVAEAVAAAAKRGHRVTIVPPDRNGVVPAQAMIDALEPDTHLVTMMLVNNETGVVQPVAEVAAVCADRGILFHCDAVQAAGKIDVDVKTLGADMLSLSAHKLHAPKGIGALYVRKGLTLAPHLLGGAQERRRRAGTENVPLAAAFGRAAELAGEGRERVRELRDRFEQKLAAGTAADQPAGTPAVRSAAVPAAGPPASRWPPITINGAAAPRVPNTSSVTFRGADAEGIVIGLDLAGVAVSTGSACSSGRIEPSPVLLAMGLTPAEAKSTVRFSLSRFTTGDEIDQVLRLLRDLVPRCLRGE